MKAAKKPDNEVLRINFLKRLDILDSKSEEIYDDLTRIASVICKTPISLISLVDENRQWFKSSVGLDASETPRDLAFCGHAILENKIFEIPDSHTDERFCDNPLVTGAPNVRFYAGAPLISKDGLALGTLCVIDSKVRQLNNVQRACLLGLARQVVQNFELRLYIKELQKIDSLKDEFIANVSHELRTPLTSIQGSISLLSNMKSGESDSSSELISIALRNSEQLMSLVNEILDIQELQHDGFELTKQPFPIKSLSSRIYELTHQYVVQHDCQLFINDNNSQDFVNADERRLLQVITNFVSNAAKFSKKSGRIEVDIRGEESALIVTVTDNGIGIPSQKINMLFKKFGQLHANATKTKGTGLGLCIAKRIIELHNGTVFVESAPNIKTTFGFRIEGVICQNQKIAV